MMHATMIAWLMCGAGLTGPAATQPAVAAQQALELFNLAPGKATAAFDAGANLGRWDGSANHAKALPTLRLLTLRVGGNPVGPSLRPLVAVSAPFASGAFLSAQPSEPVGSIRYVPALDLPPPWAVKFDQAIDVAVVVGGAATVGAVIHSLISH